MGWVFCIRVQYCYVVVVVLDIIIFFVCSLDKRCIRGVFLRFFVLGKFFIEVLGTCRDQMIL